MNYLNKLVFMLMTIFSVACHSRATYESDYEWIPRRNHVRYTIAINPLYPELMSGLGRSNEEDFANNNVGNLFWEPMFHVEHPFAAEPLAAEFEKMPRLQGREYLNFGFQLVEYDKDGLVITPNKSSAPLRAHDVLFVFNSVAQVLAADPGRPGDRWYLMGTWFYGFPGDKGSEFSPALCDMDDRSGRYSLPADWKMKYSVDRVARQEGKVGCREWAYQLKRPASLLGEGGFPPDANGRCKSGEPPESLRDGRSVCGGLVRYKESDWQPYIDVTTRHGKKPPRIGVLLGWASFNDPIRPVIGQFGKYWLCFHECPDGEKPGVIENIGLWAARRGWPNPENRRLPFFRDSEYGPTPSDWED